MTLLSSLDTTRYATPRVYCGIGGKTAFENLVPTDNLTSLAVEELLGVVDYEALEIHLGTVLLVAFDAELLDARLTFGAFLPLCLGALVATNVNILRGENIYYLGEYVLDKSESSIVTCAEYVSDTPHIFHTSYGPPVQPN